MARVLSVLPHYCLRCRGCCAAAGSGVRGSAVVCSSRGARVCRRVWAQHQHHCRIPGDPRGLGAGGRPADVHVTAAVPRNRQQVGGVGGCVHRLLVHLLCADSARHRFPLLQSPISTVATPHPPTRTISTPHTLYQSPPPLLWGLRIVHPCSSCSCELCACDVFCILQLSKTRST